MSNVYDQVWAAALKIIELRPHSQKEMEKKLKEKFYDDDSVKKVIDEMKRIHLINDAVFTEQFIHHLTLKNIGRLKIIHEARKRGLSDNMTEQVLLGMDWSEKESIGRAIDEKERVLRAIEPRKKKQKLLNFLRNRGFSERIIFSVLKDLLSPGSVDG